MANRFSMDDVPRLVLDANIMIGALLGRSFPFLLLLVEESVLLFAAIQQLAKTRKQIKRISQPSPG